MPKTKWDGAEDPTISNFYDIGNKQFFIDKYFVCVFEVINNKFPLVDLKHVSYKGPRFRFHGGKNDRYLHS